MADSIKATPQNPLLAKLAATLRAAQNAGDTVQIPLLGGLGSLLLEDYANEAEELSFGNAPMTVPAMTRLPQFKKGRGDVYAGLLFDAAGAKGLKRGAEAVGRYVADSTLVGGRSGVIPIEDFVKNAERFRAAVPEGQMPLYHVTRNAWTGDKPNPGTWFSTGQPYLGNPFGDQVRAYSIPLDTRMSAPMERGGDFWTKLGNTKEPVAVINDSGVTSYVVQDPSVLQRLGVKKFPSLLD